MKKILLPFIVLALSAGITFFSTQTLIENLQNNQQVIPTSAPVGARTVLSIQQGGATSTIPGNNMILIGTSTISASTTYNLVRIPDCAAAGETLNFSSSSQAFSCGDDAGGTVSIDWQKEFNFGRSMLTSTTTIDIWAKSGLFASSTLTVNGLSSLASITATGTLNVTGDTTLSNASTTGMLTVNGGFISSASSTIVGNLSISGVLRSSSTATSTLAGGLMIGTLDGLLKGVTGSIFPAVSGTDYEPALTFGNMLTRSGNLISGSTTPTFSGLTSTSTLSVLSLSTLSGMLSTASSTFSSTLMTSGLLTANNGILSIASSTFSSNLDLSGGTVKQRLYPAFSYSTSTSWTGTTSIPLGPSYTAEIWNNTKCFTNTGTVRIGFNDGTNFMNPFQASATVGTITLNENNSFTASEKRYVDIGNPASSPTRVSCSIEKIINAP